MEQWQGQRGRGGREEGREDLFQKGFGTSSYMCYKRSRRLEKDETGPNRH